VARYVDGYLLVVPKKNLAAYRRMAVVGSKVWKKHGALEYFECVGDDLNLPFCGITFPKVVKLKRGEMVVFSWIVYRSRAVRDRVNAAVMKDPALAAFMSKPMPFDMKRMSCGGFKVLVEA
jgi:uncharacterized protein YbaA (DUF1428 family)